MVHSNMIHVYTLYNIIIFFIYDNPTIKITESNDIITEYITSNYITVTIIQSLIYTHTKIVHVHIYM